MYVLTTNQSCRVFEDYTSLKDWAFNGPMSAFYDFTDAVYVEEAMDMEDEWLPLEDSDGEVFTYHWEAEDETVTVYKLP